MRSFVEKYRDILLDVTGNLFILGLISLILHHFTSIIVSVWVDISLLAIITFTSGFSWFFIFIQKDEEYFKAKTEPYFRNLFLAGLFVIAIGSLTFEFIESNQLLSSVVSFISSIQFYLVLITIGFGFSTFYFNRDKLEDIEEETRQEELTEKKREMEFAEKYPWIDRVWEVRWIGKWMYKEGWYSVLLLLLVLIGFGLRIWDLDFLPPFKDEYYHLVGAKRFMMEGTFNYSRAKFLTYIIGILFEMNGGTSLFLGRLPSVIFGTLSIIAIYFVAKQINKKVGIISAYLFVFSPLAIGISRFSREYQAYFLFILISIFYLIYYLKTIDFNNLKYKKNIGKKEFVKTFVLSIPALYYLTIEKTAMIIELYVAAIIFSGIYIIFSFKRNTIEKIIYNKKTYFILILLAITIRLCLPTFLQDYNWLIGIGAEKQYHELFFNPDFILYDSVYLQWFSGSDFSKPFAISLFILPLFFFYKNKYFVSSMLTFLTIYIMFVYFIDRYYAPRYVYYAFAFYFIVYACATYLLLRIKNIFNPGKSLIYLILISIILLSFFNPFTGVNGLMSEDFGVPTPNGGLVHRDISELINNLEKNNFSEKDVLISANGHMFQYYYNYSFIENSSQWPLKRFNYMDDKFVYDYGNSYNYNYLAAHQNNPKLEFLYEYDNQVYSLSETERMNKIIQKYENGWIVIDKDRNRNWNKNGFPLKNYTIADKEIIYLGSTSGSRGFDIYKWKTYNIN